MAHLAKYTGGFETKRLYDHWSRARDNDGNYITYPHEHGGSGHIERDLSKNNYTIGDIKSLDWISKRLEKVYQKPNQKRPIQTCDIIVTLPTSESKDEANIKRFFQAVYDSLKKQYGKNNNIVGAWVHLDESQPHIHFAFLPISERNSKQLPEYKEKLSTRAYWSTKSSLQDMHKTLQKDIDSAMGHHVEGIYDGRTKEQGGNKSIIELKKLSNKLQEFVTDFKSDSAEELEKLEGELKREWFGFGEEYYKLDKRQYERFRTLAKVSIAQSLDYEKMKQENTKLNAENENYRKRMHDYYKESESNVENRFENELNRLREANKKASEELRKLSLEIVRYERREKSVYDDAKQRAKEVYENELEKERKLRAEAEAKLRELENATRSFLMLPHQIRSSALNYAQSLLNKTKKQSR